MNKIDNIINKITVENFNEMKLKPYKYLISKTILDVYFITGLPFNKIIKPIIKHTNNLIGKNHISQIDYLIQYEFIIKPIKPINIIKSKENVFDSILFNNDNILIGTINNIFGITINLNILNPDTFSFFTDKLIKEILWPQLSKTIHLDYKPLIVFSKYLYSFSIIKQEYPLIKLEYE